MLFEDTQLDKWSEAAEEDAKVVGSFLLRNGFELKNTRGSHHTYDHPLLKECVRKFPDYFKNTALLSGRLIVIYHKGKCKSYILKRIVEACRVIQEFNELLIKHGGGINCDKKH